MPGSDFPSASIQATYWSVPEQATASARRSQGGLPRTSAAAAKASSRRVARSFAFPSPTRSTRAQ